MNRSRTARWGRPVACGGHVGRLRDGLQAEGLPHNRLRAPSLLFALRVSIAKFGNLVLKLLRELADESAYQRHLAAHNRRHSAEEWRRFSEARLEARFTRPKCC